MPIFGHTRADLHKRIGHPSQLGGLKAYTLTEGRAQGIRAVDFRTTQGFEFTVLLDRGMDISEARYRGQSLCWRSPAGDVAPAFYNPKGVEWVRTFGGGLLITCGLTNVGPPTQEPDETGLHGRYSACAAEKVALSEYWEGETPMLQVRGIVREAYPFGPQLEVHRTLTARGDGAGLTLRDTITNTGPRPAPCMVLYHMNTGFPLVDDATELLLNARKTEPRDDAALPGLNEWSKMHAPVKNYVEQVFFHDLETDTQGFATVTVMNPALGLGLRFRYLKRELPEFTQWKCMHEQDYVLGIEPGNCRPLTREGEREAGRLVELAPGQQVSLGFELEVVAEA